MMPRNPFGGLVRLRSVEKNKAGARLAASRAALDEAREALDEAKARYHEDTSIADVLTPTQLRSLQLRGMGSLEMLTAAADAHEKSRRRVEKSAGTWRKSAAELDAAESLDTTRKEEIARLARITADKTHDDLLSMLHTRLRRRT